MKQKDEILTRSIDSAIEIVLKPGQMLIIPPGWWHEVKSLDLSVSVNIWTAEPSLDKTEREKEALTRIMGTLCQGKISTPSVEKEFGDINQLLNFMPKSKLPVKKDHHLFHTLTHPKVIETIMSVYQNN